ncbi:MAG TPA: phage protein GemA/Gp16 family protein, partial [Desulfobacterales bacterium]|nr:phage protein GemA/Gp16 family protein [Desulfobacterales bacterium]
MSTVGRDKIRTVDKFEKEKTDKSLTKKADKPSTNTADKLQERRHKLLALVHIAKKEIPLSDDEYRDVIAYWGVQSSADMSNPELEELVKYFESLGFKKKAIDPRD